jgi:probable phosphoglycerate mutase
VNADPSLDRGLSDLGMQEARNLGRQLVGLEVDLVVTSSFPRAQQTAALAVEGRTVPHLVIPGLDDVRVGDLEGRTIVEYRAWKQGRPRSEPFPGGESLDAAAARYARAYEELVGRDEDVTLVVCHEIPVRYAVNAAGGSALLDAPLHDVPNAVPYLFGEAELAVAAGRIEQLSRSG